jgi:hypothetical protein
MLVLPVPDSPTISNPSLSLSAAAAFSMTRSVCPVREKAAAAGAQLDWACAPATDCLAATTDWWSEGGARAVCRITRPTVRASEVTYAECQS